ncbi:flagellar protein FliT [Paenibacillus rhizophilus]|uniref:Flagellar protein FliT n=1 Tax=Paenibacillus rhizophilus TaxID=1850366 RepID=A0A3N9P2Q1_9BACL|nr:flagellar protein FliT [Paenibacillus rhizophilus]RQW10065.1 flagellar protein FliT [Paenibacillus rhizophilus]
MDSLISELGRLTDSMLTRLPEAPYEELTAFVEKRQNLVDNIGKQIVENHQSLTESQKLAIRSILEHDGAILARMNAHRLEAQDGLHKRNMAKAQRSAYEAGYTPDSILMDRKK